MSHIERLKEIQVKLLGEGLTHIEKLVATLIADMESHRTTIDKAMGIDFGEQVEKLEEMVKPQASPFSDLGDISFHPEDGTFKQAIGALDNN